MSKESRESAQANASRKTAHNATANTEWKPGERRWHPPGRITLLYESRDKKLCLFEDSNGHLTAVRASRLA